MSLPSTRRSMWRMGLGLALLATSWAEARRRPVPAYEGSIFRRINGAPDELRLPARALMQAGTYGLTPVFAALAWRARRPNLAASLLVGGTSAWVVAKAIKPLAGRARPEAELDAVTLRERIGGDLGWVSGHTAVATTLAVTAGDDMPGARPALFAWAAEVGLARIYVGAHLPNDVVGGAGLGLVLSALLGALRRVVGIPQRSH